MIEIKALFHGNRNRLRGITVAELEEEDEDD